MSIEYAVANYGKATNPELDYDDFLTAKITITEEGEAFVCTVTLDGEVLFTSSNPDEDEAYKEGEVFCGSEGLGY